MTTPRRGCRRRSAACEGIFFSNQKNIPSRFPRKIPGGMASSQASYPSPPPKGHRLTHSAAPPFQAANAPLVCGLMRWGFGLVHPFRQHSSKRNTTHSGGVSFWSTFDLRCKSPACGDFYRKAEGNPQRFPPQTPPSSRRTKDSAFVRRKELAADTHARSAF